MGTGCMGGRNEWGGRGGMNAGENVIRQTWQVELVNSYVIIDDPSGV